MAVIYQVEAVVVIYLVEVVAVIFLEMVVEVVVTCLEEVEASVLDQGVEVAVVLGLMEEEAVI